MGNWPYENPKESQRYWGFWEGNGKPHAASPCAAGAQPCPMMRREIVIPELQTAVQLVAFGVSLLSNVKNALATSTLLPAAMSDCADVLMFVRLTAW